MQLIEQKRRNGVSLTTLGFGEGNLKDRNLEQLADRGNGNYFYLDNFNEARRVLGEGLTGNMLTVAKDVKLQVEFNPKNVIEYRLIGYDNRKLRNQDFANDRIDAGEIGSGHTVTALYELVLAHSDFAATLNENLRYKEEAVRNDESKEVAFPKELAFVKIRYKEPEGDTSQLLSYPLYEANVVRDWKQSSDDFRFAAAVGYFGHLLRGSSFTGQYDFQDVLELAQGSRGKDEKGDRRELIELIANAKAAQPWVSSR
jgi:Ca-activated chloride channel family protein